jgi:type VI secretion system secreted protein Hcp
MPIPGYATITGATQGNMTQGSNTSSSMGNNYQSNFEDYVTVQAFTCEVTVPTDPQSGQPTGQRVHQPSTMTIQTNKSSPLLWQAAATGEKLQIELDLYRNTATGSLQKYFTIKWTDAILVNGNGIGPNALDPTSGPYPHYENWSFTYRKIEWDQIVSGTSASDDWQNPNISS